MFNYLCLSLCTQASQEQCFSNGHYSVIGCQSKDAPQPYEMEAFYTEIKGEQVCVSLFGLLAFVCIVFWVCLRAYISMCVLFCVLLCEEKYTIDKVAHFLSTAANI